MSAEATKNQPALEAPAPAVERLNVVEALAKVMTLVQVVGKDDRNKDQGFRYRGVDAVVNAVGPVFRECGVLCIPVAATYEDERYETKKGAQMRNVTMTVTFRFIGPDGSSLEAQTIGEAADAGDKAVSKAHSVAYRTALLQTLCIPTGEDDPDSQSHERAVRRQEGPPPVPMPKSWTELEHLVRSVDNPEEAWALFSAFIRAASYHLFGKTESAELEQAQRDVIWQKACGAALWLSVNVEWEGPFRFYDEAKQRQAWASVLEGGPALEIPDYKPPEPPLDPEVEAEAEAIAAEVFAEPGDEAPATSEELAAEDTAPQVPSD